MSAPPPNVPSVLLPELLGFVPQLLLDDIINIANDAAREAVEGMQEFLERRDAERVKEAEAAGKDRDAADRLEAESMEELEKGINSFQTLLESHVDIAFDFFEAWSLRNIFAIPADLQIVAPHHKGTNLEQPTEKEAELLADIRDLRRKIHAQKKLQRLYTRAARMSSTQLTHSQKRLERLSFLRAPQLQALLSLSDEFHAMYTSVAGLPSLDPSLTAAEQAIAEPGKRPWETSKTGYLNWAVEQLMARAKRSVKGGEGEFGRGSAAAADAYGVGSADDVKEALETVAGAGAVAELGRREGQDEMDTQ
ncbi:Centromere protein [Sparassis crispa]|uniref:Centromere protein n=1 Tax=Sparassis crispa TaxID=139825 RepID=A0A401H4B7_9APHY|nr:Centromere protein [Sparassis crispa]GBE89277.1 Centromere protein [Sparassis crispa]